MSHEIYANGRNIASKAAGGKSVACFPDVCFTPAPPPPGVPIPYPNTAMASDTAGGSKTVKVGGKEVMLKNKSYFKTSTGDEAGSAAKKGAVTGKIKGKAYFAGWSMDVKIEGQNACRHLDMTTHNHGSQPGNTAPWPYTDKQAAESGEKCAADKGREQDACAEYEPQKTPGKSPCPGKLGGKPQTDADWARQAAEDAKDPCVTARKCKLVPYNAKKDGINGCCPGQTPHHVIPKSSFFIKSVKDGNKFEGAEGYSALKAPCICLEGTTNTHGTHGDAHTAHISKGGDKDMVKGGTYPYDEHVTVCTEAVNEVAKDCTDD